MSSIQPGLSDGGTPCQVSDTTKRKALKRIHRSIVHNADTLAHDDAHSRQKAADDSAKLLRTVLGEPAPRSRHGYRKPNLQPKYANLDPIEILHQQVRLLEQTPSHPSLQYPAHFSLLGAARRFELPSTGGYCYGLSLSWIVAVLSGTEPRLRAKTSAFASSQQNHPAAAKRVRRWQSTVESLQIQEDVQSRLERSCAWLTLHRGAIGQTTPEAWGAWLKENAQPGMAAVCHMETHSVGLRLTAGGAVEIFDINDCHEVEDFSAAMQFLKGKYHPNDDGLYAFIDVFALNEASPEAHVTDYAERDLIGKTHVTLGNGETLAHQVACFGEVSSLRQLASAGVDLSSQDHDGVTPAICAVRRGDMDMVEFLTNGFTVPADELHILLLAAAASGRVEIFKRLLKAYTQASTAGEIERQNWAITAARHDRVGILQALKEAGVPLDEANAKGQTPAWKAAVHGQLNALRFLHNEGCDLNAQDMNGRSAARVAVAKGHVQVLHFMCQVGCDVCAPDADGARPIDIAIRIGAIESVALLLNARSPSANEATRLSILAAESGETQVLWMLHAAGHRLDRPDTDGSTPAAIACRDDQAEVLLVLLHLGYTFEETIRDLAVTAAQFGAARSLHLLSQLESFVLDPALAERAQANGHRPVLKLLNTLGCPRAAEFLAANKSPDPQGIRRVRIRQ